MIDKEKFKKNYNFLRKKKEMEERCKKYERIIVTEKDKLLMSRLSIFVREFNKSNKDKNITLFDLTEELNQFYFNIYKLSRQEIPDQWPMIVLEYYDQLVNDFDAFCGEDPRDDVIWFGGYALLSSRYLHYLTKYINDEKCLEIMCGNGMLGMGLIQNGVDVIRTTDVANNDHYWVGINNWVDNNHPIIDMDAFDAIEKYGKNVSYILCSFPPEGDTDYRIVMKAKEVNPNCKIIFIRNVSELSQKLRDYNNNHFCQDNIDWEHWLLLDQWNNGGDDADYVVNHIMQLK